MPQSRSSRSPGDAALERVRTPPPAPFHHLVEGIEIVAETPGPLGLVLLQIYRRGMMWAMTPPADRPRLAGPRAERRIRERIRSAGFDREMRALLLKASPLWRSTTTTEAAYVSLVLRRVALRLRERELFTSAASVSDVAARLAPGSTGAAYDAARHARRTGQTEHAEAWFRYGLSLARRLRDRRAVALHLLALGAMVRERGATPRAERLLTAGLRAARRAPIRYLEAVALHELFIVAITRGAYDRAEALARDAAVAYGPGARELRNLAQDLAYTWTLCGRERYAVTIIEALLPLYATPADRLRAHGNLARASGLSSDATRFERSWREVERAVVESDAVRARATDVADALAEAGRGALALGDEPRARWAIARGVPIAREANAGALFALEELAGAIGTAAPLPSAGTPSPESEELSRTLVALLTGTADV